MTRFKAGGERLNLYIYMCGNTTVLMSLPLAEANRSFHIAFNSEKGSPGAKEPRAQKMATKKGKLFKTSSSSKTSNYLDETR